MTNEHPCLIEAPHPRHEWYPLVADPECKRVLHMGLAALVCPGVALRGSDVPTEREEEG